MHRRLAAAQAAAAAEAGRAARAEAAAAAGRTELAFERRCTQSTYLAALRPCTCLYTPAHEFISKQSWYVLRDECVLPSSS